MTKQRIREIMANPAKHKSESDTPNEYVYRLIKQAVNEALEEAAEKAEAWVDTKGQWTTLKEEARVSKKSILNLKVK